MNNKHTRDKIGVGLNQIIFLVISNLCFAVALDCFYAPNNIAAGGLAGIGTIINSFCPVPIGITVFILNIPIVIWAFFIKGKRYVIMSLIAVAMYSIIVDLLSFLPRLTDDMIVSVICGGILYGCGAALTSRAQISAGGTDLLAKLLITRIKHFSLGKLYLIIDGAVVIAATIAYENIESGIYAILAIAVCSIVTDKINSGFNSANMFLIFIDKDTAVLSEKILAEMDRGVTLLNGTGMYTNSKKDILLVVVKPNEVPRLKAIVKSYDNTAFVVLVPAAEIIGNGFEDLDLTVTIKEKNANRAFNSSFGKED